MAQLHSLLLANHRPYAGVYADATARLAATGFVRALGGGIVAFTSDDLYKKALQLDDASEWVLTATTPTWVQVGGPGLTPVAHAASHENGGADEIDVTGLSGILGDPQVAGAVVESGGPTVLTVGAVANGEFVKRVGTDLVGATPGGGSGLGDVVGPGSATDNAVARYDSTTGKLIQNSNLTVPDDAIATEVGYLNIPQNSKSADYTAVLADRGCHIFHPVGDNNPRTFTIPANSSVAYPVGTAITFVNKINTVTIAIATDTLTWAEDGSTGSRSLAANGIATALKITSTEWLISGTGLS